MNKTIPLITSGIAGPLGVLHLPRLWQKASLQAAGKLHPEYKGTGPGYDFMTLEALGIEPEKFVQFIEDEKPSYTQCEQWVLEQNGGSLDESTVNAHNQAVIGYQHSDETRAGILEAVGIADTGAILDAVNLNNLEDWQEFYQQEIQG